jgi:peptidylprolyl isomerase
MSSLSALLRSMAVALLMASSPATIDKVCAASQVTTPSGLRIIDTHSGKGVQPQAGQDVTVHYTGWLYVDGKKGKKFDSSRDRGEPFTFTLGHMNVIKGWDEGVATMRVGGKRTLIIPPDLGYGVDGAGNDIPPNATLIFDVELLGVK